MYNRRLVQLACFRSPIMHCIALVCLCTHPTNVHMYVVPLYIHPNTHTEWVSVQEMFVDVSSILSHWNIFRYGHALSVNVMSGGAGHTSWWTHLLQQVRCTSNSKTHCTNVCAITGERERAKSCNWHDFKILRGRIP